MAEHSRQSKFQPFGRPVVDLCEHVRNAQGVCNAEIIVCVPANRQQHPQQNQQQERQVYAFLPQGSLNAYGRMGQRVVRVRDQKGWTSNEKIVLSVPTLPCDLAVPAWLTTRQLSLEEVAKLNGYNPISYLEQEEQAAVESRYAE
jgi:hypothetical protein